MLQWLVAFSIQLTPPARGFLLGCPSALLGVREAYRRPERQVVVVDGNPQHRPPGRFVAHFLGQRSGLFGSLLPMFGVVKVPGGGHDVETLPWMPFAGRRNSAGRRSGRVQAFIRLCQFRDALALPVALHQVRMTVVDAGFRPGLPLRPHFVLGASPRNTMSRRRLAAPAIVDLLPVSRFATLNTQLQ